MSDLKLFEFNKGQATELAGSSHKLEKSLQALFEQNLPTLLGVHFLVTEHATGKTHAGRIDTLGIDENGCPVIIEYKRSVSENVVNQGLFYLDWLLDHQAEFKLLVLEQKGAEYAKKIDWSAPRLICIAADYKKYDEHAIRQINRNIDLIRYKRFGDHLMALELAATVSAQGAPQHHKGNEIQTKTTKRDNSIAATLQSSPEELRGLYEELCKFILRLGDDVSQNDLKLYTAFRRLRNFATVAAQTKNLRLYLHVDPDKVQLEEGFTRDVREIGHWGTGDLEVWLKDQADLEKAESLILNAYNAQ